ncbi:hypothetical protein L7F22_023829 [Adiantum nelumboides]|nr:hypothetical protein [Adiantum nelumboides]
MYAKCCELERAQVLLGTHKSKDLTTWTALIGGYAREGQGQRALECFEIMQQERISPDAVTYVSILKACAILKAVNKGERIHDEVARQGLLESNVVLGNALVDMYVKCGALSKARDVVKKLPFRDVVSWSTLISGYAEAGQGHEALTCFECMQKEGILPNSVTYTCSLKACGAIRAIDKGQQIHNDIKKQGLLQENTVLGNALVDMYAKCGAASKAHEVLKMLPVRNVVSWNALIAGYTKAGQGDEALNCFMCMKHEGILPDAITYACTLNACAAIGALDKGKQIHAEVTEQELLQSNIVLGSSFVDMYAKCGALSKAQDVLDKLPSRNVVSWNALIAGFAHEGKGDRVLACFQRMQHEHICPNAVTYACILKACAIIGDIDRGKLIHDEICKQGLLEDNIVLGNAIVDMYAKCGAVLKAHHVLEKLRHRNLISWSSLITGYAQEGQGEQALNCFKRMLSEGILPDAVTLLSVLNMCSHLGLVQEGHEVFISMIFIYRIKPDLQCYACIVDLLGRAGQLEKAAELIQEMGVVNSSTIWLILLAACQRWGDINVGKWAFEQAIQVDKCNWSAYVLMANIYAAAGMQENAKDTEALGTGLKAQETEHRVIGLVKRNNPCIFYPVS